MISLIIAIILAGSVFITSGLFKEIENPPKEYFVIITLTLLLTVCFTTRKGIGKLKESLHSSHLLVGVTVVCMLASVHAFMQYFNILPTGTTLFPVMGTFDNPAGFAAVQAAMFPFVVNLYLNKENDKILRILSLAVAMMCFTSVVMSGSRAGFMSICAAIVVVMSYIDTVISYFKTHRWIWMLIIVIFTTSFILLYLIKKDSADGRIFIWKRCIDMIKERPLFGYGPNGFHGFYMSAQANFFRNNPDSPFVMLADNVGHPFNEYLFLTIKYGMTGLALAVSLLVWVVLKLLKTEKETKVLGLSFVASMFVMSQFSYPFRYVSVWLLTFLALVPAFLKPDKEFVITSVFARFIPVFLLLVVLSFSLRNMYYEMKWAEISKRALIGQADKMIKYYDGMPSLMKRNPLFLYNYAAELNLLKRNEESIALTSQLEKKWNDYDVQILRGSNYYTQKDKEKALEAYEQAHDMIPCRFEPLYGKLLVYRLTNDTVNSVQTAYEILEKPIKVRSDRLTYILYATQQILSEYEQ